MTRRPPVHPRSPGYDPTASTEKHGPNKGVVTLVGVAALTTALATGYLLSRGGESHPAADVAANGPAPATASQYPGMTESPQATITASPTPETSTSATATTSESATPATSPTPSDIYASVRRAAAARYNRCDLGGYTNSGEHTVDGHKVTQIQAELVFENNATSATARENGESKKLSWSNPAIVLVPVTQQGKLAKSGIITMKGENDQTPHKATFNLPYGQDKGTEYFVGVETTATTPDGDGGHNTTHAIAYCGPMENMDGKADWRPPVDDPDIPAVTVYDTHSNN